MKPMLAKTEFTRIQVCRTINVYVLINKSPSRNGALFLNSYEEHVMCTIICEMQVILSKKSLHSLCQIAHHMVK